MSDRLPLARCAAPDGSDIAVYDLGGEGPALLFAHATGFHALTFRQLARHLASSYRCLALDFRAHGTSKAADSWNGDWAGLADDVLCVVSDLQLVQPFAFGHSAGGAAILLAEERAPGTFRHLYCYEPIVTPSVTPQAPDFTHRLAVGASHRRERFASIEEARANYASKPPLSSLEPAVLDAYVEHGFEADPEGGVRLRCRPSDESRVFAHAVGHDAFARLPEVRCAVDLACGQRTDSFGESVLVLLEDRLRAAGRPARLTVLEGLDHFAPMSHPARIAAAVAQAFADPPVGTVAGAL